VYGDDHLIHVPNALVSIDTDLTKLAGSCPALHVAVDVATSLLAELGEEAAVHVEDFGTIKLRHLKPDRVSVLYGDDTYQTGNVL
jgi:hypothetical protein